jgi:hypothetical protein
LAYAALAQSKKRTWSLDGDAVGKLPANFTVIAIDGAFVKGRRPTDPASLEIITGRIGTESEPSKMFAIVRDRDGKAKQ